MSARLQRSLRFTLLVLTAFWLAANVTTSVWYGMATLDRVGAMNELPQWTTDKAVAQLTKLQPAPRGDSIISDASDPVVARVEAPFFTGTPLFFFGSYLAPNGLGGTTDLGDTWSRPLGVASTRAAITKAIIKHNALYDTHARFTVTPATGEPYVENFVLDSRLSDATLHSRDTLLLESLNPTLFNGWKKTPQSAATISLVPYGAVHDFLVYVPSAPQGERYRAEKTLFRSERDFAVPDGHTQAVGRNLLFSVINPTTNFRLELSFTATIMGDDRTSIPPAVVIGSGRFPLPAIGNGAARIFSPPITPQMVDHMAYIELDMGRDGSSFPDHRKGLMSLYGRQFPLDPRKVVGFIRDVSIVSDDDYRSLRAPSALTSFPRGLEDPNLEFSGIYEDGWMAKAAAVWLSAPERGRGTLTLHVVVPRQLVAEPVTIVVMLDGRLIDSVQPAAGDLVLHEPAPDDGRRHEIQLTASRTFRLPNGDGRPASMLIESIGFD